MSDHHRIAAGACAAAFLAAPAASAATLCVRPTPAPGCVTTIQAAVDAAGPGDVVKVAAGTYFEAVVLPAGKDGLQILGASKLTTILDPSPYSDQGILGGSGIIVRSRLVSIKNLMVRNGDGFGLVLESPDATLQGLNVTGATAAGIFVGAQAWNARIIQNEIHNVDLGIHSVSLGTLAQANLITGAARGVVLDQHGGQVIGNSIYNGEYGVIAIGPNVTVVKTNDIRHQTAAGISLFGAYPTVQGNKVYGVATGIMVSCLDCITGSIVSNSVTDATGSGIVAETPLFSSLSLVVQGNNLLRTGFGIDTTGTGIQVKLNKVTDVGTDLLGHCFTVNGDDNTLTQNTATRCSQAGIHVQGSDNYVDRNVVSGTFENGVTVDGSVAFTSDNVLTGNKATGNAAQGLALIGGALNTLVTGNTAIGNRLDICDNGTGTIIDDNNTFDGPPGPCVIAH